MRALLTLTLLLVPLSCGGDARPHLFLVTADTLRADHLSLSGYPRDTSPRIDALAAEAWYFPQAVTVLPKTGPSFTTHHTGLHPESHGVRANKHLIPGDVPMLAERLRAAGYRTAAFVSNPILEEKKGYGRGFEVYRTFAKTGEMRRMQDGLLEWMEERSWDEPTFVWVHYIDPHGPYTPPEELSGRYVDDELFQADQRRLPLDYERLEGWPKSYVRGAIPSYQHLGDEDRAAYYVSQYDAEIHFTDQLFGELVARLGELGLYEESGLLFTSDHGESLVEHDYFFEHGWLAFDGTLRIPFVLKPPGPPDPRRFEGQVCNLDTVPTLLAIAGLEVPAELPGRALFPAGEGGRGPDEPLLVENCSTYPERWFGLRTPLWKYLVEEGSGRRELYDLSRDPGEIANTIEQPGNGAEAWAALLEQARSEMGGANPRASVEGDYGSEHLDDLEALGYVEKD